MTFLFWIVVAAAAVALAVLGYFAAVTRKLAAEAERNIPMKGRTITVDGERIHYVDVGQGPPILFIHGLGGQLQHFDHPLFAAMGEGYRLVALDRPGAGYSTRTTGGARIPEQAALIAGFIDALGLERPLVVGHSLGGAIALSLALDHPQKIAGLALISPLTHYIPEPPGEFKALRIPSPVMRRLLAHTIAIPMALRNAPKTLAFVFGPQEAPADFPIAGGGFLGLRPSQFYAVSTDLVVSELDMPSQEKRYGELKMPVGILFGDADRVLAHDRHGLAMRDKAAGLDLEILEGIGHMPQFVAADRVAAFVRRMAGKAFAPVSSHGAGG